MCYHYEKLIFTCPLSIGSEKTINMTSSWLTDLYSTNFSISLEQKITRLEPINLPRLRTPPVAASALNEDNLMDLS